MEKNTDRCMLPPDGSMTAEKAVLNLVENGDTVFIGGLMAAVGTVKELIHQAANGTKRDITISANLVLDDIRLGTDGLKDSGFRYRSFFFGSHEKEAAKAGICSFVPLNLSDTGKYLTSLKPDVAIIPAAPPDEQGFCNLGPLGTAFNGTGAKAAERVILQINRKIPAVNGIKNSIHVSQADGFVEADEEIPLYETKEPTSVERKIADHILNHIKDGACIQLGIGGVSNAVGFGLRNLKHLGVHSEMFSESMVTLQREGVIDNSRKTFHQGKSLVGYTMGKPFQYEFVKENDDVFFAPYEYVNKLENIARNDNMTSINTAAAVDLSGQVCSESIGFRQISGSGGQLDFVRGAAASKGGKSFIAIASTVETKEGRQSRIVLSHKPGAAVTTPRTEIQYIATEYGCVDLRFSDVPSRVQKLISIAHPAYREELSFQAKKHGLLY